MRALGPINERVKRKTIENIPRAIVRVSERVRQRKRASSMRDTAKAKEHEDSHKFCIFKHIISLFMAF